jgi:hypothetical protein
MAVRDTQIVVETLETNANPNTRNTQVVVETLETNANPNMRNSQVVVEALIKIGGGNPPLINIIT